MNNQKKTIIVAVVVLLIAAAFIVSRFFGSNTSSPIANAAPASITGVVMAKSIDAKGNPVDTGTVFSSLKDKQIYAVFSLKDATMGTTLAYVRYLNDKFVDSKVMHPATNGAASVFFSFEKGVGFYPKGNYRLVSYVNGKRSIETTYSFQ